jgi:hypothetical protein
VAALAGLALAAAAGAQAAPRFVVFTWQGDTGTTLTVNFQTLGRQPGAPAVHWDTEPRDGDLGAYRHSATGARVQIDGLPDRWFHRVELTGLEPGAAIWLAAGAPATGSSREHKVRTLAVDGRPLRFVSGGDMGPSPDTRVMLRQAARLRPDFALLGGDIAYANGAVANVGHWDTWLAYWTEEMVTPDGFSVPVAAAIGNHEVRGGYAQPRAHAPFWFAIFAQDARSYFARRFGRDLGVVLLDSGHVADHGGEQASFLDAALLSMQDMRHRVAIYHVPLYPSHRDFEGPLSAAGREHWAPLFDRHRVAIAFENHDHTLKRSVPLRGGRPADDGVLYLGDGCFGQVPRAVTYGGRWYLSRQGSARHFWCVDVAESGLVCRAIDRHGRTLDVHPATEPDAAAAAARLDGLEPNYLLPASLVDVAPLRTDGTFERGATAVTLRNDRATPLAVQVALQRGPAGARATASPLRVDGAEVPAIPAGGTGRVAVELRVPAAIAAEAAQFRLEVAATFADANGKDVTLRSVFAVPVAR